MKLDKNEQDILDSFEKGEWERVENPTEEIRKHQPHQKTDTTQKTP